MEGRDQSWLSFWFCPRLSSHMAFKSVKKWNWINMSVFVITHLEYNVLRWTKCSPSRIASLGNASLHFFSPQTCRHAVLLSWRERLKTRESKTRDWKTRHQTAGVENARLENAGVWKVWKAKISKMCFWLYWLSACGNRLERYCCTKVGWVETTS